MEKISAVIISFNEEKKIADCINSLKPLVDEVLVVDSFSTDKTLQIVKSLGGKLIQHPFEGYIQQKNYALTQAANDWVLSLDADEVLSDTLRSSIMKIKENPRFDGYRMNRLTFLEGKPIKCCGWYPDTKLRLFRRSKGNWTGLNPHDEFRFDQKTATGHLKGDLYHYSFDSKDEWFRQADKFARISAESYLRQGRKTAILFQLLSPLSRFFRDYFLKGGWLNGRTGWEISLMNAKASRLKYRYLRLLKKGN
jgi:glycosyltransferase involved in cell wall biosynthesis